jgi:BlaI family penicillinase repressor
VYVTLVTHYRVKHIIHITEAEWEVMAVVWERAPVAAATILEFLEQKKQWSLATVRTLLRRLVNKGALKQQSEGKRYLYSALVSRDECVRRESDSFLDRVLGRSPAVSIMHLVRKADLTDSDIQELRRILKEKESRP